MTTKDQLRSKIQTEALDKVRGLKRSGIAASMGIGKTFMGIMHMAEHYNDNCMFLVVAPKKTILAEWVNEAKKHGYEHLLPHIKFTTYISLHKQAKDFDVVYLDECHSLLFPHASWLNQYNGIILGLTGTPPRFERSEKGQMVNAFCPIVFEYETDDAVKDKILNDYRITVHLLSLNTEKNMLMQKGSNSWYTSEMTSYLYWTKRLEDSTTKKEEQIMSVMRMKNIMNFPSKELLAIRLMNNVTDKCILFANTQEQADRLCEYTYHSGNPDSEINLIKFKSGEVMKLAGVLQLNEGVNIPNLKECIILHAYGNERKSSQRIGRMLRLNPDETASIHILCYKNTVDERWVKSALEDYDPSKITYIEN